MYIHTLTINQQIINLITITNNIHTQTTTLKDNETGAALLEMFECLLAMLLPMEVRCYISCFRCLARNARCNTMSHLTADAVCCTCLARNARCSTTSLLTAIGCITFT